MKKLILCFSFICTVSFASTELKIIKIAKKKNSFVTSKPKNWPLTYDKRALLYTGEIHFIARIIEYNKNMAVWRPIDKRIILDKSLKTLNMKTNQEIPLNQIDKTSSDQFIFGTTFISSKKWEIQEFQTPPFPLVKPEIGDRVEFFDQYFSFTANLTEKKRHRLVWAVAPHFMTLPIKNGQKIEFRANRKTAAMAVKEKNEVLDLLEENEEEIKSEPQSEQENLNDLLNEEF